MSGPANEATAKASVEPLAPQVESPTEATSHSAVVIDERPRQGPPSGSRTSADGEPPAPGAPPPAMSVELMHGNMHVHLELRSEAVSIGSTSAASVVLAAPFLAPVHATISWNGSQWIARPAHDGALVLSRGVPVDEAPLSDGTVLRLADRAGNFASLRCSTMQRRVADIGGLRGPLPRQQESLTIGSGATAAIRLSHPLIRPRHAIVRRDHDGSLWVEDKAPVAGTYVNGARIHRRARLEHGDLLQVGPFSARVGADEFEPVAQVEGVLVDAVDAYVQVVERKGNARTTKTLLADVNVRLEPASLTAVAGPSGAGKSTLMRLLAGQTAPVRGLVAYNTVGLEHCRAAYRALMGFVPQDDIVHADLTVEEALEYQARLRLGEDTPMDERRAAVDRALDFVDLQAQRGQLVRTLSGGQRKRVSVATELLIEPKILFLDEPTSGLDPGLDKRMMLLLRLLADQGRTVVLTTHAITHVNVCDTLIIVGPGGHVIYAGPPEFATRHFGVESLGDVFALIDDPVAAEAAAARLTPPERPPLHGTQPAAASSALASRDSGYAEQQSLLLRLWPPSLRRQTKIFASRQMLLMRRDPAALTFSLLQGIAVALLTALVVTHFSWVPSLSSGLLPGAGQKPPSGAGAEVCFVFACAAVWFGMINSVRELVKERTIWRRENLAGAQVQAYLASKVLVLGLLAVLQALSMTALVGITLHFDVHGTFFASAPLGFLITLSLANFAGIAIGLLISAVAPSSDRAMSLVPYLLLAQLILCGVLFPLHALKIVSWVIPARWADFTLGGVVGLYNTSSLSGTTYASNYGELLGGWLLLVALVAFGVVLTARALDRQAKSWTVG